MAHINDSVHLMGIKSNAPIDIIITAMDWIKITIYFKTFQIQLLCITGSNFRNDIACLLHS